MAVVGTLIYISLVFFSPSKGILPKYYRKEEMNKQIIVEDIIKYIYKHQTDSKLEFSEMSKKIGHPENKIKKTLKILKTIGFIGQTGDQIQITEKGKLKSFVHPENDQAQADQTSYRGQSCHLEVGKNTKDNSPCHPQKEGKKSNQIKIPELVRQNSE